MDLIGYASSITKATSAIDFGRKGFATRGKAEEGRISYENGIAEALIVFKEAQASNSHKKRLQNRSPGIDPIEKSLLEQRFANLSTTQNGYMEKQKKSLQIDKLNSKRFPSTRERLEYARIYRLTEDNSIDFPMALF